VKELVSFGHQNLQGGEALPTPAHGGYDAIFCRNVMIYFNLGTTKQIVEHFSRQLRPGGCLFLGHAETLAGISTRFERHIHDGGFFYRRKELAAALPAAKPPTPAAVRKGVPVVPLAPPVPRSGTAPVDVAALFARATEHLDSERYAEAAPLLRQVLALDPGHAGSHLGEGLIHANNGQFNDALECCDTALALDDLLPEAYFLRGLVHEMLENPAEAKEEYRKAILLRMDFVMPHYQLGKLCFRTGEEKLGVRELRNSLRFLEKGGDGAIIPFSGGLSREVFIGQVRDELARLDSGRTGR
jgi:chemotaxis protein methyltransferase CheR